MSNWVKGKSYGKNQGRKKKAAAPSVYLALVKCRVEPVNRIIKIAETCSDLDTKIGLWKYLIEQRFAEMPLLIEAGLLSPEKQTPDLLNALESIPTLPVPTVKSNVPDVPPTAA